MIIAARANLGVYDARYVEKDGRNWIEVATNNFLFAVQMINLKRCDGNLSGKINPLLMALARSKELLGHPWNQELPRCPRLQENLKRLAEGDIACSSSSSSSNINIISPAKKQRICVSKEKKQKKGIYRPVSPPPPPLPDDQKLTCQADNCNSLFSSHAAAKTHFIKRHPTGNYVPPPRTKDPTTGRIGVQKKREDKVRQVFEDCV